MPFNGSGVFGPISAPDYPAVANTLIRAAQFNANLTDIFSGLTNCLTRDGQGVPTANLPMSGFKHTGVADATSADQYLTLKQAANGAGQIITGIGGTADVITGTVVGLTAYTAGQIFTLIPSASNTGAVTLNLNGLGAVAVQSRGGAGLGAGQLAASIPTLIGYTGTSFRILATTGTEIFRASSTSLVSINIPHGTAPTTPNNGDFWTTTSGLFGRINGNTRTFGALEVANTWTAAQTINANLTLNSGFIKVSQTAAGAAVTGFHGVNTSGAAGASVLLSLDPGNNGVNTRDAIIEAINNGANQITLRILTANAATPAEALRVTPLQNLLLGLTTDDATHRLQVAGRSIFRSGNTITAQFGADDSGTTLTDSTGKTARIGLPHYLLAEEPIALLHASAGSSSNIVRMGGGTGQLNAATSLEFYTAANSTTTTGTVRATISSSVFESFLPFYTPAASTSAPSLRMPHGTAPTSPTNGDLWTTTSGMFVRVNGATQKMGSLYSAIKTSSTTRSTTTSSADPHLSISGVPVGSYRIEGHLFLSAAANAVNFKWNFNVTNGVSARVNTHTERDGTNVAEVTNQFSSGGGEHSVVTAFYSTVVIRGVFDVTSSTGTLTLEWSTVNGGNNITLEQYSHLQLTKIA